MIRLYNLTTHQNKYRLERDDGMFTTFSHIQDIDTKSMEKPRIGLSVEETDKIGIFEFLGEFISMDAMRDYFYNKEPEQFSLKLYKDCNSFVVYRFDGSFTAVNDLSKISGRIAFKNPAFHHDKPKNSQLLGKFKDVFQMREYITENYPDHLI